MYLIYSRVCGFGRLKFTLNTAQLVLSYNSKSFRVTNAYFDFYVLDINEKECRFNECIHASYNDNINHTDEFYLIKLLTFIAYNSIIFSNNLLVGNETEFGITRLSVTGYANKGIMVSDFSVAFNLDNNVITLLSNSNKKGFTLIIKGKALKFCTQQIDDNWYIKINDVICDRYKLSGKVSQTVANLNFESVGYKLGQVSIQHDSNNSLVILFSVMVDYERSPKISGALNAAVAEVACLGIIDYSNCDFYFNVGMFGSVFIPSDRYEDSLTDEECSEYNKLFFEKVHPVDANAEYASIIFNQIK